MRVCPGFDLPREKHTLRVSAQVAINFGGIAHGYPTGFTTKELSEEEGNKINDFLWLASLIIPKWEKKQTEAGGFLQVWPRASTARAQSRQLWAPRPESRQ